MTTKDTPVVAATDGLKITFEGRIMRVTLPDENQLAALIASQEFFRRHGRRMDELAPQLDALGTPRPRDHPLVVEAEKLSADGIKHAGRFQTILKTLLLDEADWDFVQDGMADKSIKWQNVADIPALIIEARNAQGGDANRADRRAAKKAAGRLAR